MKYEEYKLNVSHIEALAQLRVKLKRAESLLESKVDVASILSEHAEEMNVKGVVSAETNRRFQSEIRQYTLRRTRVSQRIFIIWYATCVAYHKQTVQVANVLTLDDVDGQNYRFSK